MIWYSHFLKNFSQFAVIHTIKGFSVVSEAEIDIFMEFSCFFYYPANDRNLISGSSASLVPLPCLNPAGTSRSSWFMNC